MKRATKIVASASCASLILTGCGLPNRNTPPEPRDDARVVLPYRYDAGGPSAQLRGVYEQVLRHVEEHPDEFGGAHFDWSYETVRVWTAAESAWSEAGFAALRNELDPEGELIGHQGTGKSLSYLRDLREKLLSKYDPDESSRIADIYVDPTLNGVRVLIEYRFLEPELRQLPLAKELTAFAPEVHIQDVGSPNVAT